MRVRGAFATSSRQTPGQRGHGILVRNVLIYFSQVTKRDILERMAAVLNPGGILMLGAGESLVGIDLPLERYSVGATSLYRRRQARPSQAVAAG